jgi:ATP sulfurylase
MCGADSILEGYSASVYIEGLTVIVVQMRLVFYCTKCNNRDEKNDYMVYNKP